MKSSAYQSIHDVGDLYWSSISGDRKMSALWDAGLDGGLMALEENQRPRFSIAPRRLIYLFQNVHYQRRKGVVDDELWGAGWHRSTNSSICKGSEMCSRSPGLT